MEYVGCCGSCRISASAVYPIKPVTKKVFRTPKMLYLEFTMVPMVCRKQRRSKGAVLGGFLTLYYGILSKRKFHRLRK